MSPFSQPAPVGGLDLGEESQIFGDLFLELRDGLESTRRLMGRFEEGRLNGDERAEARRVARHLAVAGRTGFMNLSRMNERAPELYPRFEAGWRVVARLSYCLLVLSGDDPEPLALISTAELDTILRDEGGDGRLEELVALVPADRHRED